MNFIEALRRTSDYLYGIVIDKETEEIDIGKLTEAEKTFFHLMGDDDEDNAKLEEYISGVVDTLLTRNSSMTSDDLLYYMVSMRMPECERGEMRRRLQEKIDSLGKFEKLLLELYSSTTAPREPA